MKVKVQSGHSITLGRDHFLPGDICELEDAEARRLIASGVVAAIIHEEPASAEGESFIDGIVSAIASLPIDDGDLWTKGGKPQIAALEDVLQKQITSGERDKAWRRYQEGQG